MKVCVNYSKNIDYKKAPNINFGAKSMIQKTVNKTTKKVLPFAFVTLLLGLVGISCNGTSNRYSDKYNYDGISVEFTEVQPETKDSVLMPVMDLKSKLTEKCDFLKNLKIDVIRSFRGIDGEKDSFKGYLRENHSASHVKGISFYSDDKLEKRVAIQERAHKITENNISKVSAMQQTLMHEIGHQFDNHFGHNHNSEIALKWDSLQHSKSLSEDETPYDFYSYTEEEQSIDSKYNSQNELSDRREFKQAFLKDLNNIRTIMNTSPESLPQNINYYISGFDLEEPINIDMLEGDIFNCAEVYANTFSYLMNTNEGDKEAFLKAFPNCKEIVQKDIVKYLNLKK